MFAEHFRPQMDGEKPTNSFVPLERVYGTLQTQMDGEKLQYLLTSRERLKRFRQPLVSSLEIAFGEL